MRARPAAVSRASSPRCPLGVQPKGALVAASLDVLPDGRGGRRPFAGRRGGEVRAQPGRQFAGSHGGQAAEQAMRGQHDQARVFHRHEHHQHEVGRMLGLKGAGLVNVLAIGAGGLVAVMAVGDEHRLRARPRPRWPRWPHVGDRPKAIDHAQVIGGHQRRQPRTPRRAASASPAGSG